MIGVFENNSALHDYQLKHRKLVFNYTITGNATPASKAHGVPDLPAVVVLRSEGKVADADAIETISFTTAADNSTGDSVHGVLIKGSALGSISKVLSIKVTDRGGTATSLAVTAHGTKGLSTGGNIAFSIAGTGLNLSSENADIVVEVDYVLSE